MVDSTKAFASLAKQENSDVISTHCFIYSELLISKSHGDELKKVFNDITRMVNFIKQKPVHFRMLKRLCENLEKRINLLLHTEIRWLSRARVPNRVCEKKDKLHIYFHETNKQNVA